MLELPPNRLHGASGTNVSAGSCMSDTRHDSGITRATGRLPGLDIDVVHRPATDDGAEQISITLKATPSFEAFGRALESVNPFAFWMQAMQLAWWPWAEAARLLTRPGATSSLPRPNGECSAATIRQRDAAD